MGWVEIYPEPNPCTPLAKIHEMYKQTKINYINVFISMANLCI